MKKLLAILMAAIVCLSAFSACTPSGETASSPSTESAEGSASSGTESPASTQEPAASDEELYVIPLLLGSNDVVGMGGMTRSDESMVGEYIRDNFGIVFEFSSYAGDLREKQSLMLAAEDYNEMASMQRDDIVQQYISAGALIELDPYLADAPNFSSRFEEIIPYWQILGEGTLYKWESNVPRELDTDIEVNDVMVRSDLLEKYDWNMPLSATEWVEFFEEVVPGAVDVNGNPIVGLTLPMAESWGLAGVVPVLYEKSEHYLPLSNEGFTYNHTTDRFEDYFMNPYVKESYKFFSDLNRRGLLDPECFTDTADVTQQKASTGSVAAMFYTVWLMNAANNALTDSGNEEMCYIRVPIQSDVSVANGEKRLVRMETTRSFNSWGLTKNCRDPEKIMKLLDWASTDEGQIMLRSGIEGVHWERDESGNRVWTDEFVKCKREATYNRTQGVGTFGAGIGIPQFNLLAEDGQPHDLASTIEWIDGENLLPRQKEAYEKLGWDSSLTWYSENIALGHTGLAGSIYIDPTSDLGKLHIKMTETRVKHTAPMIMATTDEEFEAAYAAAMAEYDKLDHESVIDEFNRLYDEQKAALEQ